MSQSNDELAKRIRDAEDAARRRLSTLSGLLLGFSLLAVNITEKQVEWLLVSAWAVLAASIVVGAIHEFLLPDWIRDQGTNYQPFKKIFNVVNLVLLVAGLVLLLSFLAINLDNAP